MLGNEGTLQALTGGVRLKQRVQHPKVHERKDRGSYYWFFRYRHDELLPNGTIKTTRKFHTIGSKPGRRRHRQEASGKQAGQLPAEQNAAPTRCEAAVVASQPVEVAAILFGKLAELWRKDYVDNPIVKLATPTREKYRMRLDNHILPRWKEKRLGDLENEGNPRLAPARVYVLAHDARPAEHHERHFRPGTGVGDSAGDLCESDEARESRPEVDGARGAHPRR